MWTTAGGDNVTHNLWKSEARAKGIAVWALVVFLGQSTLPAMRRYEHVGEDGQSEFLFLRGRVCLVHTRRTTFVPSILMLGPISPPGEAT